MNKHYLNQRLVLLLLVAPIVVGCSRSTKELVEYANKNQSLVADVANGKVVGITIRDKRALEFSIARIDALGNCQILYLIGLAIDADSFGPLSKLPIEELYMFDCKISKGARTLIPNMKHLTRLHISAPHVGEQTFADAIAEDPQRVDMEVNDSDLASFSTLPQLFQLDLTNHRGLTGAGFRTWDTHSKLRKINLYGSGITDEGIKEISRFSQLRGLTIRDSFATSDQLLILAKIEPLTGLGGVYADIKEEDMKGFAIRYNDAYKANHPHQLIVPFPWLK